MRLPSFRGSPSLGRFSALSNFHGTAEQRSKEKTNDLNAHGPPVIRQKDSPRSVVIGYRGRIALADLRGI